MRTPLSAPQRSGRAFGPPCPARFLDGQTWTGGDQEHEGDAQQDSDHAEDDGGPLAIIELDECLGVGERAGEHGGVGGAAHGQDPHEGEDVHGACYAEHQHGQDGLAQ